MEFADFQRQLAALERERGWDRVLPSHTFVHIAEELGEVGRILQCLEGYRESELDREALHAELAGELADLATLLFKLANQHGIDMGAAMQDNIVKFLERYHDIEMCRREFDRYASYQERNLDWIRGQGEPE